MLESQETHFFCVSSFGLTRRALHDIDIFFQADPNNKRHFHCYALVQHSDKTNLELFFDVFFRDFQIIKNIIVLTTPSKKKSTMVLFFRGP
jgi:hypothetical protein